tara:strand:- start:2529 stop:3524 length:996 start_codon:yes stop_codon:yes gene_type:complete
MNKNNKLIKLAKIFTDNVSKPQDLFQPNSVISLKLNKVKNIKNYLLELFKTSNVHRHSQKKFDINNQKNLVTTEKIKVKNYENINKNNNPSKKNSIFDFFKITNKKHQSVGVINNTVINTNFKNTVYNIKKIKNLNIISNSKNDDYYSTNFFNVIDKKFTVLLESEKRQYIKEIKINIMETFNRLNFYKKFNYSSKDFKKSFLEETLANNKIINKKILKVYCDLFGFNFVSISTKENNNTFHNKFNKSRATYILYENMTDIESYLINNTFIKGYDIYDILKLSLLNYNDYNKLKIDDIRNYANMLNISSKKMGKIRKINKTKEELIQNILN